MKKYIAISIVLLQIAVMQPAKAQVSVSINIGVQPLWGPVGYNYVEYYYLPDYQVYYSVPDARFVYFDAGQWIFAPVLPPRFGTINYYSVYKVVINQPKAYLQYNTHKVKYVGYKGKGSKQVVIRDSREPKYYVVKGHPNYGQSKKTSAAPAPRKAQTAPQKGNYKQSPAPASQGGQGGGNKGGGQGGGNSGGGKGKGGGKPK